MSEHIASPTQRNRAADRGTRGEPLLQRKCACGQHTVAGGECAECRKKRLGVQRWTSNRTTPEAFRSYQSLLLGEHPTELGQGRFGCDFSRVQAHTSNPAGGQRATSIDFQRFPTATVTHSLVRALGGDRAAGIAATACAPHAEDIEGSSAGEPAIPISPSIVPTTPPFLVDDDDDELTMDSEGSDVRRLGALRRDASIPGSPPAEDVPATATSTNLESTNGATISAVDRFAEPDVGGRRAIDDPRVIQEQLSTGQPLDGGVRSRMESAFGRSFGHVRVHRDVAAARLSRSLDARAFTVGEHVAFGVGEYRPGTVLGDALIAHELAHVIQQGTAAPSTMSMGIADTRYSSLEADADRAAVGVVASLWGHEQEEPQTIVERTTPLLRSGLALQRCGTCSAGGTSTVANTIVCDGSGGIKVKVTSMGGAQGEKCGLVDCATKHEESHRSDTLAVCPDVCKGQEDGARITMSTSERAKQEVKASNVEIACLQGHLAKHKKSGDSSCQTTVEARIKQMEEYRDGFK